MRILKNGQLLKTKIVATVGEKRGGLKKPKDGKEYLDLLHDAQERPVKNEVEYGELLTWLIREGADVIRLNMSFASQEGKAYGADAKEVLTWLANNRTGLAKWIVVLGDLPGPKIRLGLENEISLEEGDKFLLDFVNKERLSQIPGHNKANVLINDQPFCDPSSEATVNGEKDIDVFIENKQKRNEKVVFFIGDGQVQLEAKSAGSPERGMVECKVLKGGTIKGKPGFTIKKADIRVKPFLDKDREALDFLLEHGEGVVAYIGVSFVNTPNDVINVKRHIEERLLAKFVKEYPFDMYIKQVEEEQGTEVLNKEDLWEKYMKERKRQARRFAPHVIAKFETREACKEAEREDERDCIDKILDVADGAMVARGDLGLQLDPQEVPAIQKRIIRKCNLRGKPVITATQMLDSMENNIEPTRAEASDVFNAIQDGTDAVMLSGETSKGKYPPQAVRMMSQIAEEAEQFYMKRFSGKAYERRLQTFMDESDELSKETTKWLARLRDTAARQSADAEVKPRISPEEIEEKKWKKQWYAEKRMRIAKQKITDRISESACLLSEARDESGEDNALERNGEGASRAGDYKAIVAPTTSGRTARMIARFRPNVPIIGVAHDEINARKMVLSYGVYPLYIGEGQKSVEDVFDDACREAIKTPYSLLNPEFQLLKVGDVVISTSGTPLLEIGTTNLIQIREIESKTEKEEQKAT
jgi:pyruvate kinase